MQFDPYKLNVERTKFRNKTYVLSKNQVDSSSFEAHKYFLKNTIASFPKINNESCVKYKPIYQKGSLLKRAKSKRERLNLNENQKNKIENLRNYITLSKINYQAKLISRNVSYFSIIGIF